MFTFPQEEPSTTWPTSPPIMDRSCDGSNGSPRQSPRGIKKTTEDCNSVQDGRNNVDDKVEDLDNCNDDVNDIKDDKDDSDYVDDVDNNDGSGTHERGEDGKEETEVAKEKSNRKRKRNKKRSRKKKSTTEITSEENAEMNVKENGEENKNVEVYIKGKVATIADLFTGERKNIKVDRISYSSRIAIETRRNKKMIEYRKVYRCLMVLSKKNKKEGWVKLARHRDSSNTDFVGCKGRMVGFFAKDRYWFWMKECHTCNKGGGSLDNRPKIQMISPAPSWHITRDNMWTMRKVLEGWPKNFWENLTHQGPSRQWLKEIAAPQTEQGESVRLQIEEMMKPYLNMITFQNPH